MTEYWSLLFQRDRTAREFQFLPSVVHRYSNNCGNQVEMKPFLIALNGTFTCASKNLCFYINWKENETVCGYSLSGWMRWISLYLTSVQAEMQGKLNMFIQSYWFPGARQKIWNIWPLFTLWGSYIEQRWWSLEENVRCFGHSWKTLLPAISSL